MDYESLKCPVCTETFKKGDDIVVCPECGTPHHRRCYEKENRCAFEEKHGEGYVFGGEENARPEAESAAEQEENSQDNTAECPRCKTKNPENSFYCSKCGFPLKFGNGQNTRQDGRQNGGFGFNGVDFFDPMAGVNPEYKLDEDVNAGEAAKYVQKNTQYFSRVFFNIKEFAKGKFNFCAFLFSGGYLLYRKMYKIGAIISSIMFLLMVAQIYIQLSPSGTQFFEAVNNASQGITSYNEYYSNISEAFFDMNMFNQIMIYIMMICSLLEIGLRIFVGVKANRWYFNHTVKKIRQIKSGSTSAVNNETETLGGVNTALALSMFFVYLVIEYLPSILSLYL